MLHGGNVDLVGIEDVERKSVRQEDSLIQLLVEQFVSCATA